MQNRFISYCNSAIKIIESYNGVEPFNLYIKKFFAANKKYGSKDRKYITTFCFNYFRIGFAFDKKLSVENILVAYFLCNGFDKEMALLYLDENWEKEIRYSLDDKIDYLGNAFDVKKIFPFENLLSKNINHLHLCKSYLTQPDLFVRVRPSAIDKQSVEHKLSKLNINYEFVNNYALKLPTGIDVDAIFKTDNEVVIQDYSSQQVLNFVTTQFAAFSEATKSKKINVWDCCAASGGKSILLNDLLPNKICLTVSDVRPGSIFNLHQRFKKAGVKKYDYFIADLTKSNTFLPNNLYDIIICDVPCTGSGTWSRTPNQMYFFNTDAIKTYTERQQAITERIIPYLKPGGLLFYITCSIFKSENEDIVAYLTKEFKIQLMESTNIIGYDKNADTMYVAVLRNSTS